MKRRNAKRSARTKKSKGCGTKAGKKKTQQTRTRSRVQTSTQSLVQVKTHQEVNAQRRLLKSKTPRRVIAVQSFAPDILDLLKPQENMGGAETQVCCVQNSTNPGEGKSPENLVESPKEILPTNQSGCSEKSTKEKLNSTHKIELPKDKTMHEFGPEKSSTKNPEDIEKSSKDIKCSTDLVCDQKSMTKKRTSSEEMVQVSGEEELEETSAEGNISSWSTGKSVKRKLASPIKKSASKKLDFVKDKSNKNDKKPDDENSENIFQEELNEGNVGKKHLSGVNTEEKTGAEEMVQVSGEEELKETSAEGNTSSCSTGKSVKRQLASPIKKSARKKLDFIKDKSNKNDKKPDDENSENIFQEELNEGNVGKKHLSGVNTEEKTGAEEMVQVSGEEELKETSAEGNTSSCSTGKSVKRKLASPIKKSASKKLDFVKDKSPKKNTKLIEENSENIFQEKLKEGTVRKKHIHEVSTEEKTLIKLQQEKRSKLVCDQKTFTEERAGAEELESSKAILPTNHSGCSGKSAKEKLDNRHKVELPGENVEPNNKTIHELRPEKSSTKNTKDIEKSSKDIKCSTDLVCDQKSMTKERTGAEEMVQVSGEEELEETSAEGNTSSWSTGKSVKRQLASPIKKSARKKLDFIKDKSNKNDKKPDDENSENIFQEELNERNVGKKHLSGVNTEEKTGAEEMVQVSGEEELKETSAEGNTSLWSTGKSVKRKLASPIKKSASKKLDFVKDKSPKKNTKLVEENSENIFQEKLKEGTVRKKHLHEVSTEEKTLIKLQQEKRSKLVCDQKTFTEERAGAEELESSKAILPTNRSGCSGKSAKEKLDNRHKVELPGENVEPNNKTIHELRPEKSSTKNTKDIEKSSKDIKCSTDLVCDQKSMTKERTGAEEMVQVSGEEELEETSAEGNTSSWSTGKSVKRQLASPIKKSARKKLDFIKDKSNKNDKKPDDENSENIFQEELNEGNVGKKHLSGVNTEEKTGAEEMVQVSGEEELKETSAKGNTSSCSTGKSVKRKLASPIKKSASKKLDFVKDKSPKKNTKLIEENSENIFQEKLKEGNVGKKHLSGVNTEEKTGAEEMVQISGEEELEETSAEGNSSLCSTGKSVKRQLASPIKKSARKKLDFIKDKSNKNDKKPDDENSENIFQEELNEGNVGKKHLSGVNTEEKTGAEEMVQVSGEEELKETSAEGNTSSCSTGKSVKRKLASPIKKSASKKLDFVKDKSPKKNTKLIEENSENIFQEKLKEGNVGKKHLSGVNTEEKTGAEEMVQISGEEELEETSAEGNSSSWSTGKSVKRKLAYPIKKSARKKLDFIKDKSNKNNKKPDDENSENIFQEELNEGNVGKKHLSGVNTEEKTGAEEMVQVSGEEELEETSAEGNASSWSTGKSVKRQLASLIKKSARKKLDFIKDKSNKNDKNPDDENSENIFQEELNEGNVGKKHLSGASTEEKTGAEEMVQVSGEEELEETSAEGNTSSWSTGKSVKRKLAFPIKKSARKKLDFIKDKSNKNDKKPDDENSENIFQEELNEGNVGKKYLSGVNTESKTAKLMLCHQKSFTEESSCAEDLESPKAVFSTNQSGCSEKSAKNPLENRHKVELPKENVEPNNKTIHEVGSGHEELEERSAEVNAVLCPTEKYRKRKQACPMQISTRKKLVSEKDKSPKKDTKLDEGIVEKKRYISGKKTVIKVRQESKTKLLDIECSHVHQGGCSAHGPLQCIGNSELQVDDSTLTMPDDLCIRSSKIEGAGIGIHADVFIEKGTIFGPYDGVVNNQAEVEQGGHLFKMRDKKKDVKLVRFANWLKFLNFSSEEDANIIIFRRDGAFYCQTVKPVPVRMELLMKSEYIYELGLNATEESTQDENDTIPVKVPEVKKRASVESHSAFPTTSDVSNKEQKKQQERYYKCKTCHYSTISAYNLRRHERIHERNHSFKCTLCDKSFTRLNYLKSHSLSHKEGQRYPCEICGITFSRRSQVAGHSLIHQKNKHDKEDQKCDDVFSSQDDLEQQHFSQVEETPITDTIPKNPSTANYTTVLHDKERHLGSKLQQCEDYGKRLTHTAHKKPHITEYSCEICGKHYTRKSNLTRHSMVHMHEKSNVCMFCGVTFAQATNLQLHIRTHVGPDPYKCSSCNIGFAEKLDLTKHQLSEHSEKGSDCQKVCQSADSVEFQADAMQKIFKYACTWCKDYKTDNIGNLQRHERKHTGEKPFKCRRCGKAFVQKIHLIKHSSSHPKEKLFLCELCGSSFALFENLTRHKVIHLRDKGLSCPFCNKIFDEVAKVALHVSVCHPNQQPHKCKQCNRGFPKLSDLEDHETSEHSQTYPCSVQCGKSFPTEKALLEHKELVHLRETKKFKCPSCPYATNLMCDFRSHSLTHREKLHKS